jgi:general secretion pathway protein A
VYESFYKFEKPPFKLVADPSMLYASSSVQEALSRLEYAVRSSKGLTVMTGEVGTGKTTLVNRFLDKAGPELRTAYIFNPTLSGLQLLKTLADELGVLTTNMSKVDLTRAIYDTLLRHREAGQKTIVFVDEAQILSHEALEELRLISNLETWQEKLLNIVLVAQPELLEKLRSFNLRQLRQRVELFIEILPMSLPETQQYIEHRLRIANPLREVHFTEGACQLIHRLSAGIPRQINKICDAALLGAFVDEATIVTSKHVRDGVETMEGPQHAAAVHPSSSLARRSGRGGRRFALAAVAVVAVLGSVWALDQVIGWRESSRVRSDLVQTPRTAPAQAPEESGQLLQSDARMFVHLASFPERSRAEAFAANLGGVKSYRIYLQQVETQGQEWTRVLIGNFASLEEARRYADRVRESGLWSYAQAVRVPEDGIEPWGP